MCVHIFFFVYPFFFLLRFCFCFFCHSSLHQRLTFLPYTHITINGDFAILYTLPDMDESVRCFCKGSVIWNTYIGSLDW